MKALKVLTVAACLAASVAYAAVNVWVATLASTDTAAPTSASDGVSLVKSEGLRIMACAPVGNTVSGGTLQAWYYDNSFGGWVRTPELDLPVPSSSGQRCINFGDLQPLVKEGRALWKTNGVVDLNGATPQTPGAITVRVSTGVFQ